jgi:hypothetical protein
VPPVVPPLPGPIGNLSPNGPTGLTLAGGVGESRDFVPEGTVWGYTLGDPRIDIHLLSIMTSDGVKAVGPDGRVLLSTTFGWPAERKPVPGAPPELRLGTPTDAQTARIGCEFVFELPHGSFVHTDPDNVVNLIATKADGQPLPAWLSFDDISGIFSGTPPAGSVALDVLVVARDQEGRESQQTFRLNFTAGDGAQPCPANLTRPEVDSMPLPDETGADAGYAGAIVAAAPERSSTSRGAISFGEQLKAAKPRHAEGFARFLDTQGTQRNVVRPVA